MGCFQMTIVESDKQEIHDFFKYISARYFFVKSFFVERSYEVLAVDIKRLIISAPDTLETRHNAPNLALLAFFELSIL